MTKSRRLTDLYIRGRDVTVTEEDGQGNIVESLTVYLRKLNPVAHERAFRLANAARSKFLAIRNTPDAVEYQAYLSEVYDIGEREKLIEFVSSTEVNEARMVAESKVAAEEEWAKDDYVQGLKDVWELTLQARSLEEPDDPEVIRVRDELARFGVQVDEELAERKEAIEAQYTLMSDEELCDEAVKSFIKMQADFEWGKEFQRCQIWLATYETDDHSKPYFGSREEVDTLETPVIRQLQDAYNNLSVDPIEVKDSEVTPISSPSAVQPNAEATGVSSSPLSVVQ